jgi:class 3 adenylate cyclase/CheY-like chemotaxis protein
MAYTEVSVETNPRMSIVTGERILVVDDAAENRNFVVDYVLEPNEYQTLTATNGKEGLEMALKHRPDLIVLDYNMPVMDGPDMIRALHQQGVDIPIILMTFHGSEDIVLEVFRLGVRDFINKPFYPEEMEQAIDKHLAEVRLRREKDALTERVLHANLELKSRLQELNMLYRIGKYVTSNMPLAELFVRVVDTSVQMTHAERGIIHLIQDSNLVCRANKEEDQASARASEALTDDPIAQHVVKSGKSLVLDTNQTNKLRASGTIAAYTPLSIDGNIIGALGVERKATDSEDMFTSHDTALLSAISDYVSIAIFARSNLQSIQAQEQSRPIPSADTARVTRNIPTIAREISILQLDIHGIPTDDVSPQDVINGFKHYLNIAREIISQQGGNVISVTGDGLTATFNAPQELSDHPHRCAQAAINLIQASQQADSDLSLGITYRIGVDVGNTVVGIVNEESVKTYTAIGDTVNLSRRLLDYAAPGQALISDNLVQRLGNYAETRSIGEIRVKGRRQPSLAYELVRLRPFL